MFTKAASQKRMFVLSPIFSQAIYYGDQSDRVYSVVGRKMTSTYFPSAWHAKASTSTRRRQYAFTHFSPPPCNHDHLARLATTFVRNPG
ncbi:hypothetical protein ACFL27_16225 [candidate division CSSED10-310 bacterium]|uniref:Uncharacterized protein n=1 Tax=candidate division CSSED10-310 bacterium TaxID=2855610 RepID=A0ABV6YZY7_UNCC1